MILDHHPAFGPGNDRAMTLRAGETSVLSLRAIGYWRSPEEPFLPDPHAFVDPTWEPAEREAVLAYLRAGEVAINWCGSSMCRFGCGVDPSNKAVADLRAAVPDADVERLCRIVFGRERMGSKDLTDGTYIWPEGFSHYVEVHHVRPPEAFVKHVLGK